MNNSQPALRRAYQATLSALFFVWDVGKTLITVLIIAFLIRFYLVQPFYVEGQSMEPNFNNGEYLLIDEISYKFREPQRGEVVVFKPPVNTYQNYIKRIIALPGEKVSFHEGPTVSNDAFPEGKRLDEPYLSPEISTQTVGSSNATLQKNQYYVLGDNRPQSSDSRVFGPIDKKNIIGKVWLYIKIKPWKTIRAGNRIISIPTITDIGSYKKPDYPIDQ